MAKYNLYILSILNILCILYILSILNKLEDVQHNQDSTYTRCTTLFNRIPAPVYAGALYWLPGTLPGQYAARSIKSARFLPEFVLNTAPAARQSGMVRGTKCHNSLMGICILISNNAFQLTFSLKKGQLCPETRPNNYSLVQGSPLIMPIMALLAG